MPIIPTVGRKSWNRRLLVLGIYLGLCFLGLTMVVPFLITVSSSVSNDLDYSRFRPIPRYFWSSQDRFIKGLVYYFNAYPRWTDQMHAYFGETPDHWRTWLTVGRDIEGSDRLAAAYLDPSAETRARWKVMAADYSAFCDRYPLDDMLCPIDDTQAAMYLEEHYGALARAADPSLGRMFSSRQRRTRSLALLGSAWGVTLESFFAIRFKHLEAGYPYWQQGWFPRMTPKYRDFVRIKGAYRDHYFTPGIRSKWLQRLKRDNYPFREEAEVFPVQDVHPAALKEKWASFKAESAPAAPAIPFAMRAVWYQFLLESEEAQQLAGLRPKDKFDLNVYNRLAGTSCASIWQSPFPIPATAGEGIQKLWTHFVQTRFPLRLVRIAATPVQTQQFQNFLRQRYQSLDNCNRLLGTQSKDWTDFQLPPTPPQEQALESLRSVWMDFVKTLPARDYRLSSSEIAWQRDLLGKYRDVPSINRAYGWNLRCIEEAFPPFDIAYAITFQQNELRFATAPLVRNYALVAHFMFGYGNSLAVTLLLITLTIICTLTINPLAAYALSRFNLRGQDKVILFMLATMAFPAMVSAIPAYLLMRDIGLLNTFWALVLPGAANGMAIFILKGFFDSLPPELFEAATIDGAKEWQIFWIVSLPLIKPILAVNALTAFIHAYNSWEWALIICQEKSMWTIAVWMFQASQWWGETPWIVTAGFVVTSLPTFLVFVFCQKIILRGIILPTMK